MNQHYIAFGITLAALCILVAWMFITSKVSVWTRVSASAVAVCLALCMWWQVTAFLGYATTSQPSDGAVILSFAVLKPVIYLWVMEPAGPRGYILAYRKARAEALFEHMHRAQEDNGFLVFRHTEDDDVVNVRSALPEKR
jgi:hypothetical protein